MDYRIYDKAGDALTKNDHFRAMLEVAHGRGFVPEYVVFDSGYSGLDNLKQVRDLGWKWLTQLKKPYFGRFRWVILREGGDGFPGRKLSSLPIFLPLGRFFGLQNRRADSNVSNFCAIVAGLPIRVIAPFDVGTRIGLFLQIEILVRRFYIRPVVAI